MTQRRRIAFQFLAAALLVPSLVAAQVYPAKPVRVVVPTSPGLGSDFVARSVFGKLSELSNNPFPVENRFGRAGTVGAALVAKSPSDGYTILVGTSNLLSVAHLFKDLPYEPLRDFIGITPLTETVGVLVVHASLPVKAVGTSLRSQRRSPVKSPTAPSAAT